jgi:calcineurin-like phosphoesterase family protein
MSNIWFTSDSHYGHRNICGSSVSDWDSGYRDFKNLDEMNRCLVEAFNVAMPEDTIYHLGDWSFGGEKNIELFRSQIQCRDIRLCLGNHDVHIHKHIDLFTWVKPIYEGKIGGKYMFLHHYAQRIWNHSHKGSIHLYGHSHGTLLDDSNSKSMDIGFDTCIHGHKKYTLYHLDEVLEIMSKKKTVPLDHHNRETT